MRLETDSKQLTITNLSEREGTALSLRSTTGDYEIIESEICIHLNQRNSLVVAAALLEGTLDDVSAESILKKLHRLQGNKLV